MSEPAIQDPPKWEKLPDKVKVLVTVFTYNGQVGGEIFKYCLGLQPQLANDPKFENVLVAYTVGYPVPRCRNAALREAARLGYHFILMLDDDQVPDLLVGEGALPFLQTSVNFALAHDGPCLVGAPYTSAPPMQECVVMKNRERVPELPDGMGMAIDKYTRDEAAVQTGIQRVAGLPTGCLLIDTRVCKLSEDALFDYEYEDRAQTKLASTEDIVFTRNMDWIGVPSYCNWDAWAGHSKRYITGKPRISPVDKIPRFVNEAWKKGYFPKLET